MKLPSFGKAIVILSVIIGLIGEMLALYYWGQGSWDELISFILQILTFYGLGMTFLSRMEVLREAKFKLDDITSANLFIFIGGNFRLISMFLHIASLGIQSQKTRISPLGETGGCLLTLVTPVILLYALFHILVVMPVTYVFYLLASAIVESVRISSKDAIVSTVNQSTNVELSLREIVSRDPVTAKSVIVGVPAALITLILKLINLFF